MFNVGDVVRVLAPFNLEFPDTYVVEDVRMLADGSTAVRFQGVDFAPEYLEKA